MLIATDPDREGEAIASHVATQIAPQARRAAHADPARALSRDHEGRGAARDRRTPATIDSKKVEAQQARRVLDRLVGYKASPVLWKTVKKGLSAGRVQTVALRLIVEREREIRAFKPVEYWTIEALLEKDGQQFTAKLHHIDGKKAEIHNQAEAERDPRGSAGARATFDVTEVKRRERRKNPAAPFTTRTLQQEAAKKLVVRLQAHDARRAGSVRGHRDRQRGAGRSHHVHAYRLDARRRERRAPGARLSARAVRRGVPRQGAAALRRSDKKSKNAQDAHEAHSSDRSDAPSGRGASSISSADQFKLYQLVWQRFMASQMAPAVFDTTTVDFDIPSTTQPDIGRRSYLFRATGSIVKFQGFLALYREAREEGEHKALEDEQALPVRRRRREGARARASRRASTSPSRRRASPRRAS